MTNRILITHNDLDAVGCAIAFKSKYTDIEVQYHTYDTITKISQSLLDNQDEYSKIYFADISPEESEGLQMLDNDKFVILDHHETRTYLQDSKYYRTDYCGAWISWTYLYPEDKIPDFIMAVDAWDSWKTNSKYRETGEQLNLLGGYYSTDEFIEQFQSMRSLTPNDLKIIEVLNRKKQDYLSKKREQVIVKFDKFGNKYWKVFIGEPQSGLGNILEIDTDDSIKYLNCINLNDRYGSLYSLNFDVTEIAKARGGGGHPGAAGYPL